MGTIFDFEENDRKARGQEVILVDLSDKEMFITVVLWYSVCQVFAIKWKPFATGNDVIILTEIR